MSTAVSADVDATWQSVQNDVRMALQDWLASAATQPLQKAGPPAFKPSTTGSRRPNTLSSTQLSQAARTPPAACKHRTTSPEPNSPWALRHDVAEMTRRRRERSRLQGGRSVRAGGRRNRSRTSDQ